MSNLSATATTRPSPATASPNAKSVAGMGQIVRVQSPEIASAVLGSCIGLVLFTETHDLAVLAHIVLPEGNDTTCPPAKFANRAIPHMLLRFKEAGVLNGLVRAKIAGGSNMFNSSGPLRIGDNNRASVLQLLQGERIPILSQHVGGTKGRRIEFDPDTKILSVQVAGEPVAAI